MIEHKNLQIGTPYYIVARMDKEGYWSVENGEFTRSFPKFTPDLLTSEMVPMYYCFTTPQGNTIITDNLALVFEKITDIYAAGFTNLNFQQSVIDFLQKDPQNT